MKKSNNISLGNINGIQQYCNYYLDTSLLVLKSIFHYLINGFGKPVRRRRRICRVAVWHDFEILAFYKSAQSPEKSQAYFLALLIILST